MKHELLYGTKFRHVHGMSMDEWNTMEKEALEKFKANRKRYQHFNAGRKPKRIDSTDAGLPQPT